MANNNNNKVIWSKDNGVTLSQHINDILKTFEKLQEKCQEDLQEPIKLAIKLHDLGKALPYFQIVTLGNKSYEPFDVNKDLNIYHSLASVLFINQDKLKEALNNDENMTKYVLSAIAYHHWKNSLEMDLRYGAEKFEHLMNSGILQNLNTNLKEELKNIFNGRDRLIELNSDMITGLANGSSFTDYITPPYQMYWLPKRIETDEEGKKKWILISGFLQRCDHYASFCEEDATNHINQIEINLDLNGIAEKIKDKIAEKKGRQNNITLWQKEKLNKNRLKDNNLILIAPTGSGKTEFAFLWSNKEKFFYTLPLRAAVEQIYDRAKAIFGEDKTGLLHSDADVYLLGDDYNYEKIKVYEVAKQLSYPVIISTGDQFFPYGLRPPGYERIYATFSYSRLVIDEVQAYDPRATAIIVKFIEDIVRMAGKFLLMTATLPEYVKAEIEKRISANGGKESKKNNNFEEINLYEEEKTKYENLKKHKLEFIPINNSKQNNRPDFSIPDDIIIKLINYANGNKGNGKRVLVIFNTVKLAVEAYNKIKNNSNGIDQKNIILFHSRMTLNEKQKIKAEIEEKFKNPKDPNDNEGKILVATQVVEAAIDIDADILFTEICPIDSLVQRMGRVLRRYKENFDLDNQKKGINEPSPNVFALIFKEGYESGNGRVYDKELIEKTLILFDKLYSPETSSKNIDEYYHKKNQFVIEDLQILTLNEDNKTKISKKHKRITNESIQSKYISLSEYNKIKLVSKLYSSLNPYGKYLSKFYQTLSILDAGFMSDRKEEAQRIFREIMNVSVIEYKRQGEFKEKIGNLIKDNDFSYTKFKKEIIAEFVIQIPYYDLDKRKRGSLVSWIDKIQIENKTDKHKKRKEKLKKWCEDIFIVDNEVENII